MTSTFLESTMLRHTLLASALVFAAACEPSLPQTTTSSFVTAVFDPTTASIPLPNDLAFINDVNTNCPGFGSADLGKPPICAQAELLASFNRKFPSDQSLAFTVSFQQTNFNEDGTTTNVAPAIDVTSFKPTTFFIYGQTTTDAGEVELAPITAADYVKGTDRGTLTIHNKGNQPWAPGSYSVLIRGGDNGIKTTDGQPVHPSQIMTLIVAGKKLEDPANLTLLKAQLGSTAAALAQAKSLDQLINLYKVSAFPVADARFPHEELASVATFQIQSLVTNVEIDPARGLVPLPIDLLRDSTTGHLTPLAACTLAGSALAADGTCPSPAAAGFLALDGFGTTSAILAPTSDLVDATSVTGATLQLYDLTDAAHPTLVAPSTLIQEPCEFASACSGPSLSPVIAIQPAGATAGDRTSVFRTKPLKDATDYAVVMTTGIKDKAGKSIGRGTVANILGFKNSITDAAGHSGLTGIDDTTAVALEKMRKQLIPVFALVGPDQVAMAYTFHTQTIVSQAVQLAALPYTLPAATGIPITSTFVAETAAAAYTKYGIDPALVPSSHIHEVLEVDITTKNALDPATGAFLANPAGGPDEQIHALVVTPLATNTNVPRCGGGLAPFGGCAPLMVFRHGLGSGRAAMLTVADSFAAAGMVVVAIDAAKHGDRSFCTPGGPGQCAGGGACTTTLLPGAQGDANPPGTCGAAGFAKRPVMASATGNTDGIPLVSSNYLISTNFFRTRDTFRQDLIDQSQLVRVMAFVPAGAPPQGHAVFDHMAVQGVIIDPATVYFSGQSLGSIQGVADVATNPRISKAGFNVGGGTVVDVFTNSPAFKDSTLALLAGLGIQPGTSKFLQFLVVAKTVLDPADPINFAGHLTSNTLPNLLPPLGGATDGSVPQAPKKVLTQIANCDQTVPNPFNLILASNVPTGALPTGAAFFAPGATGTFQLFVSSTFDPSKFGTCSTGAVEHAFITDWVTPSLTQNAQNDLANFVMTDTKPLSVQHQ